LSETVCLQVHCDHSGRRAVVFHDTGADGPAVRRPTGWGNRLWFRGWNRLTWNRWSLVRLRRGYSYLLSRSFRKLEGWSLFWAPYGEKESHPEGDEDRG